MKVLSQKFGVIDTFLMVASVVWFVAVFAAMMG